MPVAPVPATGAAGQRSDDISELKSQMAAMQAKLDELSRKG
jgi:hypothetical protein